MCVAKRPSRSLACSEQEMCPNICSSAAIFRIRPWRKFSRRTKQNCNVFLTVLQVLLGLVALLCVVIAEPGNLEVSGPRLFLYDAGRNRLDRLYNPRPRPRPAPIRSGVRPVPRPAPNPPAVPPNVAPAAATTVAPAPAAPVVAA